MATHIYRDLPSPLRGSALEDRHWPKRWQAQTSEDALRVATALLDTIKAGQLSSLFDVMVVGDRDGVFVNVNRTDGAT